jgi:hypothetical protein
MNKHQNQAKIQITDLINESVDNAVARRRQPLELEEFKTNLSFDENEDYSHIRGGIKETTFTLCGATCQCDE